MANANSISYKACLKLKNGSEEMRRFGVNQDHSGDFNFLAQKIKGIFPSLAGEEFSVKYLDDDDEEIAISSDEELSIALETNSFKDSYRLEVNIVTAISGTRAGEGEVHVGVVCDGCEGVVRGFRYKCMDCIDYNLCAGCEMNALHPGHKMMRISVPSMMNVQPQNFDDLPDPNLPNSRSSSVTFIVDGEQLQNIRSPSTNRKLCLRNRQLNLYIVKMDYDMFESTKFDGPRPHILENRASASKKNGACMVDISNEDHTNWITQTRAKVYKDGQIFYVYDKNFTYSRLKGAVRLAYKTQRITLHITECERSSALTPEQLDAEIS